MRILLTIPLILLLTAFVLNNFAIALIGLILLVFYLAKSKQKEAVESTPAKAKHVVIQSEPPREEFPEPSMPFHEVLEKASKGKISTDALPFSRAKPHNPISSLFSGIPFNPFEKLFKKK